MRALSASESRAEVGCADFAGGGGGGRRDGVGGRDQ